MGQYWKFVNIDKRKEVRNVNGLKLIEFLFSTSAEQLVGLLRNPLWLNFQIPNDIIQASKLKSSQSPLIALPQEIIDLITEILFNDCKNGDILCLGLTCTYFFRLLARTMQQIIREDIGRWCNDKLIFVGDYASGFPKNIATPEEEAEWNKLGENSLYEVKNGATSEGRHAKTKSFFPERTFEVVGDLLEIVRKTMKQAGDYDSIARFERLLKYITHSPDNVEPDKKQAILRNLVKKEYVRDQALAESAYPFSLGEVLICFCTWTEDPSGLDGLPFKGEWAGHRFDISTMASVEGDEWTDISGEAIRRLKTISEGWEVTRGRRLIDDAITGNAWGPALAERNLALETTI